MKLRISRVLEIAALVFGLLASAQSLAQNAYITNNGNGTVSVINTKTNAVTATIPVGIEPVGVAVNPNGSSVYVTHMTNPGGTVSAISTATNSVTLRSRSVTAP
jgi:YVTN family beta-propeller protein